MSGSDERATGPGVQAELEVSTSPRSTWVWAPDRAAGELVRSTLTAAGLQWFQKVAGNERVTDVDIGVDSLEALEALQAAGYSFRWHPDQYELNRHDTLAGIPVGPVRPENGDR